MRFEAFSFGSICIDGVNRCISSSSPATLAFAPEPPFQPIATGSERSGKLFLGVAVDTV
jgi:hypothetical protein